MYSTGCLADPETTPTQLWVWNQATQNVVRLPLPEDIRGPRPSSDMGMVLFRRDTNDLYQELWVADANGSNELKIATISLEEIHQRYPAAHSIGMEYGWVQDTHTVFYETRPLYDLELGPLDSVVLVEATSGVAVSVIPRGEVTALRYSPDGTQVAALSPSELRLIDAGNGQVQSTASLGWNSGVENPLQFSPDGRILTVLTDNGVAIVDTGTGEYQEALFEYLLWGAGDWFLFVHPFHWRDPTTALMLVAPPFEVDEQALGVFTELLDWEFVVYSLDPSQGSITVRQSLRGFYPSAKFSPDLNYLAYERATPDSETRELHVADLSMDVHVLYATGNQVSFISWAPDSSRFFFAVSPDSSSNVYLGQVGQEPMKFDIRPDSITWLDDAHFVAKPASSELELHLYTVWGEDTLIASELPSE
jgi:WD40 repeat protein